MSRLDNAGISIYIGFAGLVVSLALILVFAIFRSIIVGV